MAVMAIAFCGSDVIQNAVTQGSVDRNDIAFVPMPAGPSGDRYSLYGGTPFVFAATFYENISYGKPGASLEEVREAAKTVGIDDFIMSLQDGYDTYLHDGGGMLSQGQKQLVSFARALLRDPAILILDEATSNIDTETEAAVQKAIATLLKGRTSIVIAHRLSTIVGSDRILVMDKGKVIEDGDHKTLLERKGAYYDLYMAQFKELSLGEQDEVFRRQIEEKGVKI